MSSPFDDSDDDLSRRTRRAASAEYASERSIADMHDNAHDREFTLNTGTVLALFFALALVCAVFFGFGYSMGHKSAQPAAVASDAGNTAATADTPAVSPAYKPSPVSPASQPIPGYMTPSESGTTNTKPTASESASVAASETSEARAKAQPQSAPATVPPAPRKPAETHTAEAAVPAPKPVPAAHAPSAPPAPDTAAASAPSAAATGSTYVQIAAVSHQEDADVLLSALKRRGYKVLQRSEPSDRLIHVQIGPFPTKKDAEGTRQKLLADGYNAFVK